MKKKQTQWKVVIPNYPEQIKISEKRRPKFYKRGEEDKLPKKHLEKYFYTNDVIYSNETMEPIVKNTKSVGKPRFEKVNFQKLWNGSVARHMRAKMADTLHEFYSGMFKKQLPKKIEIGENECLYISYEFQNIINSDSADLDNLVHWHIKTSLDCLTEKNNPNQKDGHKLGIIKDDNLKYVRGIAYCFVECESSEQQKLTIHIEIVPKKVKVDLSVNKHEPENVK